MNRRRSIHPGVEPQQPPEKGVLEMICDRESLVGADLHSLWLCFWDLSDLDFRNANLRGTYLVGADLSGCDLRGACLESTDLNHACLRGAKLHQAKFIHARVRGADFRHTEGVTQKMLHALHGLGAVV